MSIISLNFFIFMACVLAAYYLCPLRFRWYVLLAASAAFLCFSGRIASPVFAAAITGIAFASARYIGRLNTALASPETPQARERLLFRKKLVVRLTVTALVAILVTIRGYALFFITANKLSILFGRPSVLIYPKMPNPLGISYYTLILIGYVLDTAWKKSGPENNPLRLFLFTAYFPQMTIGPFVRYGDMKQTLFEGHRFDYEGVCFGLQRFIWGLFKKLVIAERLAILSNTVFRDYENYGGLYVIFATVVNVFYSYTDFAGGMDIVIGASQMLGVRLPENFRTPFYAVNYGEYWRRWHITLGQWFKDYVMYPFLLSRFAKRLRGFFKKRVGQELAQKLYVFPGMFVVWTCFALWHGGTYKYFFRGVWIFAVMAGRMLFEPLFSKAADALKINKDTFSWVMFQRARTFFVVWLGSLFMHGKSLTAGFRIMRAAFAEWNPWIFFDGSLYKLGLDRPDFWAAFFGLGVLFVVSLLEQKGSVRPRLARQNLVFRWALYLGLLFSVLILGMYGPGFDPRAFIYAGF